MKIQAWRSFTIFLFCLQSFPLFCETDLSSQRPKAAKTTETFVKKVQNTGFLIQTIQAADGAFVSLSARADDFVIRKSGASGNTVWERSLRLKTKNTVSLNAIVQTSSG